MQPPLTIKEFKTQQPKLYAAIADELYTHVAEVDRLIGEAGLPEGVLTQRVIKWLREGTLAEARSRLEIIKQAIADANRAYAPRWQNRITRYVQPYGGNYGNPNLN